MTARGQDQQRRPADSSHVESLPVPVREPDMQQSEQTFRFRVLLRPHLANRDDVLISGVGYLCSSGSNASERVALVLRCGPSGPWSGTGIAW